MNQKVYLVSHMEHWVNAEGISHSTDVFSSHEAAINAYNEKRGQLLSWCADHAIIEDDRGCNVCPLLIIIEGDQVTHLSLTSQTILK